jgi:hypothetical protein
VVSLASVSEVSPPSPTRNDPREPKLDRFQLICITTHRQKPEKVNAICNTGTLKRDAWHVLEDLCIFAVAAVLFKAKSTFPPSEIVKATLTSIVPNPMVAPFTSP